MCGEFSINDIALAPRCRMAEAIPVKRRQLLALSATSLAPLILPRHVVGGVDQKSSLDRLWAILPLSS